MGILKYLLGLVMAVFQWRTAKLSPENEARDDAKAAAKAQDQISKDVAKGDEDAVNKRIADLRKAGSIAVCVGALFLTACMTARVVYVPDADKTVRCPNPTTKVMGWWVSDAVMTDLLQRAQANKDAKAAQKGI